MSELNLFSFWILRYVSQYSIHRNKLIFSIELFFPNVKDSQCSGKCSTNVIGKSAQLSSIPGVTLFVKNAFISC
jgi:hypothetical protein